MGFVNKAVTAPKQSVIYWYYNEAKKLLTGFCGRDEIITC